MREATQAAVQARAAGRAAPVTSAADLIAAQVWMERLERRRWRPSPSATAATP